MQVGDIIVVSGKSIISRFIKFFTRSNWTHVAIYIGLGQVLETDWNKKAEIIPNPYTKDSNEEYVVLRHRTPLTRRHKKSIVKNAIVKDKKGPKYDFLLIIGLWIQTIFPNVKLPFLNKKNKFICTELVDEVLRKSGIDLFPDKASDIFPHDYMELSNLKEIEQGHKLEA